MTDSATKGKKAVLNIAGIAIYGVYDRNGGKVAADKIAEHLERDFGIKVLKIDECPIEVPKS